MKHKLGCVPACNKWDVPCDTVQRSCVVKGIALRVLPCGQYWRVLEVSLGSQALFKLFKIANVISGYLL